MQTKFFVLAAAMICAVSLAANNKVSGVIKDAANKTALIGVNVTLVESQKSKGESTRNVVSGTVTDTHGKFSLEAETGEFVLECSYIGYEPIGMSLAVSGNIHLGTIEMNEVSTELGEVVVEGDAVIQKVDRQILLPNKEQLGASSDGMSLLQNLQIPLIVVNPRTKRSKPSPTKMCSCVSTASKQAILRSWQSTRRMSSASSTTTSRVCALTERRLSSTTSSVTATQAAI